MHPPRRFFLERQYRWKNFMGINKIFLDICLINFRCGWGNFLYWKYWKELFQRWGDYVAADIAMVGRTSILDWIELPVLLMPVRLLNIAQWCCLSASLKCLCNEETPTRSAALIYLHNKEPLNHFTVYFGNYKSLKIKYYNLLL